LELYGFVEVLNSDLLGLPLSFPLKQRLG